MENELKPPIILFGNTRSGTTIVQDVICAHPGVVSWYEPSELWLYADPARSHDEFDAQDATEKVKRYIRGRFLQYQQQHGGARVFEKTPKNIFKIPYVHEIFPEASYLYIVRSPFSFISSVEMKWQKTVTKQGIVRRLKSTPLSQLHYHLYNYLVQQWNKRILKRKYLSVWGPRYKGIQEDVKNIDLLTVIARQWAYGSRKAEQDLAQLGPGRVLKLRYEDFVDDPLPHLERICAHCGVEMTNEITTAAREMVKADRKLKWQRFQPADLARILPEIEVEMARHGYTIPEEIQEAIAKLPDRQSQFAASTG